MKNNPHYAPENLLDMLLRVLEVRNDRQLAGRLGVLPSQICKIRWRQAPVTSAFLINMHEETGWSIAVLRGLMGDYRQNTGRSARHPEVPPPERLKELQRLHELLYPRHLPALARQALQGAHAP